MTAYQFPEKRIREENPEKISSGEGKRVSMVQEGVNSEVQWGGTGHPSTLLCPEIHHRKPHIISVRFEGMEKILSPRACSAALSAGETNEDPYLL